MYIEVLRVDMYGSIAVVLRVDSDFAKQVFEYMRVRQTNSFDLDADRQDAWVRKITPWQTDPQQLRFFMLCVR